MRWVLLGAAVVGGWLWLVIQKDSAISRYQDLCFQRAYDTASKAGEAMVDHTVLPPSVPSESDWNAFKKALDERTQRHVDLVDARYVDETIKCLKQIERTWHRCSPVGEPGKHGYYAGDPELCSRDRDASFIGIAQHIYDAAF
jgi:hypothetical protein